MPAISHRTVQLTPARAAELLKKNRTNRKLRAAKVEQLAEDMKAGRWDLNGEAIVVDSQGFLIDGQHRLTACILADRSFEVILVEGVAPRAQATIDSGAPRNDADRFSFLGVERSFTVAAAVRMICTVVNKQQRRKSFYHYLDIYKRHRRSIEWALSEIPTGNFAALGPVFGALVYAYPKAPEKVAAFTRQLVEGAGYDRGSPPWMLREYFIHNARVNSKRDRAAAFIKTCRCLQAFIEGERPTKLYATEEAVAYFAPDQERKPEVRNGNGVAA